MFGPVNDQSFPSQPRPSPAARRSCGADRGCGHQGCLHAHPFPKALEVNHWLAWRIAEEEQPFGTVSPRRKIRATVSVGDRYAVDAPLLGVGRLFSPVGKIEVKRSKVAVRASLQRAPVSMQRRMIPAAR